jgi:molybdopterin synthase catalytic subunit
MISADDNQIPSMDQWISEAKADTDADKVGMYLFHNGIVRSTAKSKVRYNDHNVGPVVGMLFSYDSEKVAAAVRATEKMDGIHFVRAWLNSGILTVGDSIMYVLVGGDIKPHVVDALQYLVEKLKTECVSEKELY